MADFDVIIRGGTIVDGTGSEPFKGDIGVKDGVITALGHVSGSADQEIDADGRVVTPGFIDIHTHLDAQVGWDPDMTPISWHGVTTALIGNCGMTFAPCKPEHRELLAGMMETVEDIPKDAILGGLSWDWENYGEYLNAIEKLGTAVNVAGLIGHAAVRYYVMGEPSFDAEANESEREQMKAIVDEALKAGAFGFSTNRFDQHVAPDGRPIPGTFCPPEELEEIATVVGSHGGLMQAVGANFDVLGKLAANSRVLFSYGTGSHEGAGAASAEALDKLAEGRDVTAISHVRGSGFIFGLSATLPMRRGTWGQLSEMTLEERVAAIRDDDFAAQLVEVAKAPPGVKIPMDQAFFMGHGEVPDYTVDQSLAQMADAADEHWSETFIRLNRETNGRALFTHRMFSPSFKEQSALFKSEHIYPGLGDAGAHVSLIMDAGWSSFMLSYWHRETGRFTLPEVIHKMTAGPARVVGLKDRGILAEGMRADINVIDLDEVSELQPEMVNDFPGGAPRFIQRAKGYDAVLVNGVISLRNDEPTGQRAGRVLRFEGAA
jgi:N-acyl-D-amino-acid deacylase